MFISHVVSVIRDWFNVKVIECGVVVNGVEYSSIMSVGLST